MSALLQAADLAHLTWLEIDITLIAHAPPKYAHPTSVLEALFKGVFEAARLDARTIKQLWHWRGVSVGEMTWQAGTNIVITVQLFGLSALQIPAWQDQLQARFAPQRRQNFTLESASPWRIGKVSLLPDNKVSALSLDFITPVPLPHKPGRSSTALDVEGFIRLCQTRLRKLFGREGDLPPPPDFDTAAWRYWRTAHRSRSQAGHSLFINGCVGVLRLSGQHLDAWQPWLCLFAQTGLGERLSFSQGRFLLQEASVEVHEVIEPVPLRLRRPFVLDNVARGVKLSLSNANLVVHPERAVSKFQLPLMRISSLSLYTPCQISTPLLAACAAEGISVVLASPGQTPLVMVGERGEAARYQRLAAHHAAWGDLDEAKRARLAARLVDAKLAGCAWLMQQRYQAGDHLVAAQMVRARASLMQTARLSVVRGWEGFAARHYHQWLKGHMSTLGEFERRLHHGQTQDPINLLLNYSYALLRHRLSVMVRLAGLDPYLGILHEANGRHEALVSDLMEPWRAHIDRLVLRWINLKVVQDKSFAFEDAVLRLLPKTRSRMVQDFTQMLESTPKSGGFKLETRMRQMLQSYALAVKNKALSEWDTEPVVDLQQEAEDPNDALRLTDVSETEAD